MLDIRLIRQEPETVKRGLEAKKASASVVDDVLALDEKRRELIQETEALKARRNEISKLIPQRMKEKQPAEDLKEESKSIGDRIKDLDEQLKGIEAEQDGILLRLPNLPHATTPHGKSEEDNVVVRTWGEPKKFPWEARSHWDLGAGAGILDLERGVKLSGSGFFVLRGLGAKLERALINWFLDTHVGKNGYEEVSVPFVVNRKTMTGTGQLPKMEEDMYRVTEDDLFLIPTAEVPVTNLHADEILSGEELPKKFVAVTPCFRREAGSSGKEVRGISRVHQFLKVEMVQYTDPEKSDEGHESLTRNATELLEALGLPYRVLSLCTGDISFAAAKCYDLEIWAPGMGRWLEVSSCSTFTDFQARRANIRFRREAGSKPEFVHTLNGSGLALPRIVIGILENYQLSNGGIEVPQVLRPYMGVDVIPALS
ncbi:MAG: serine--tRNA ligase [Candidatus Sumerlaeia bacterium]|nr:serine--tRNA ligase [Candidatus Sumerlaeia bacterium]